MVKFLVNSSKIYLK